MYTHMYIHMYVCMYEVGCKVGCGEWVCVVVRRADEGGQGMNIQVYIGYI